MITKHILPNGPQFSLPGSLQTEWIYWSPDGHVGPMNGEQLLLAVEEGLVKPQSLVRRTDQKVWIRANDIEGLSFPANSATDSKADSSEQPTDVADLAPNLEMRRLFLECLDKQKRHTPPTSPVGVQSTARGVGEFFGSSFSTVRSMASATAGSVIDTVISILSHGFKSKIGQALVIVLAIAAVTPLLIPGIADLFLTRQVVYSRLAETFAGLKELRSKNVDPQTRTAIQQRSQKSLDALLPKLNRTADTSDPSSISLLWIARDYIPQMLAQKDNASTDVENKIQYHLKRIKSVIELNPIQNQPWSISAIAIVTLDVVGACATVIFFGRRWLQL